MKKCIIKNMRIEDKIIINSTVDKVFQAFRDLTSAQKNITAIENIKVLEGPAKMDVGTKWVETRTMFGKQASETMWVTELIENNKYVVEAQSHGMKYKTTYTFVELPHEETEVHLVFEGEPVNLKAKMMNVLTIMFASSTKKMLHKDMEELKQTIENSN